MIACANLSFSFAFILTPPGQPLSLAVRLLLSEPQLCGYYADTISAWQATLTSQCGHLRTNQSTIHALLGILHAPIPPTPANDHEIHYVHSEELAGLGQLLPHLEVLTTRLWITARMIVHDDDA